MTQAIRPSSEARRARRSDKRAAILQAALDLFGELGFHGAAVPLISKRAGVGAGTIYRYFESKEALVNAVYQQWKGALGQRLLDDFPLDAPMEQQFNAWWDRMSDFALQHPRAYAFLALHHHAPYLTEESRQLERSLHARASLFLQAGTERGAIRDLPPALLIALVHGAFDGMMKAGWIGDIELTPAIVAAGKRTIWDAIRA